VSSAVVELADWPVMTPERIAGQRSPRRTEDKPENIWLYSSLVQRIRLFDNGSSGRIELVIDQRLHLFYKLLCVWLGDVIVECGLIYPARVNVEQARIANRAECMKLKQPGSFCVGAMTLRSAASTPVS
jgi:hypothetical protein